MIGIDPGLQGAIAHVEMADGRPRVVSVWDMPTLCGSLDTAGVWRLVETLRSSQFVVERVHAFQGASSKSSFNFGQGFGRLEGLLHAADVSTHFVEPREWKRQLQIPQAKTTAARKQASRRKAAEIFSRDDCAEWWAAESKDGRWEAALLAYWGLKWT